MSRASASWMFLALLVGGCSASAIDVDVSEDPAVFYAAAVPEIRVREDGLTLWVDAVAVPSYSGSTLRLALRGRTSANLKAAHSFVPDDAFGSTRLVGARSFETLLEGGHEINTILSGLPLFLKLEMTNGRVYHASLSLRGDFVRYSGDTAIAVNAALSPIYWKDDVTNLRYRGLATVDAPLLNVTTTGGVDPTVKALGSGRFQIDWDYDRFAKVFDDPRDPVRFSARTATRMPLSGSANIEIGLTDVKLTTLDAETAWPTPSCAKSVFDCIKAQPAMTRDFAVCGSYRDVQRCMYADICDFTPPVAFMLQSKDASSLAPAIAAAHAACPRTGGSWCSVLDGAAFSYARCLTMEPTSDAIIEAALVAADRSGRFDPRYGTAMSRSELAAQLTFGSGLLAASDALAGDTTVQAKLFESEESCHNCHQFGQMYVLLYPNTRVVVVVTASHGYDS